jgi:hypothetical protein
LVGEIVKAERSINKLGKVFYTAWREVLEDFSRDEIKARGSFVFESVDDGLDFGLFE